MNLDELGMITNGRTHELECTWNAHEWTNANELARTHRPSALWGPPSAKQFCGATMCAGGRPRSFATGEASSPRNCWSNGRFDDGFAFGTPAAFDVCVHHTAFAVHD